MINFVLCFDSNYNNVAYLFLHTLLNKIDEKVNLYIIHENPVTFEKTLNKLKNYQKVNSINIYKFDKDLSIFPGITHGHISDATYYRFFLDSYLPPDLDYIMYVDADIICHQNPANLIKEDIVELKKSGHILAARTEVFKAKTIEPHWERLNLNGQRYFNAGVLLIDYQNWIKKEISSQLYKKLETFKDILLYWDQDVLNMVIDDNYLELNSNLNFDLYISTDSNNLSPLKHFGEEALNSMSLLHYTGSIKPWTVRGSFNKKARYFHDAYYELFAEKYIIKNTWRFSAFQQLIFGIIKLHIKNLRYPFSFIFSVLKSLKK
ncbi:hypothetical protein N9437_02975 [Acidimicrobiia bacterium]|nr:hypothetical protein [Acidimicrobiia bacterium]